MLRHSMRKPYESTILIPMLRMTLAKRYIDVYKRQAYMWGNSRLGYWRVADSPILKMAISNDSLRTTGYVTLMGSYLEWHPK